MILTFIQDQFSVSANSINNYDIAIVKLQHNLTLSYYNGMPGFGPNNRGNTMSNATGHDPSFSDDTISKAR